MVRATAPVTGPLSVRLPDPDTPNDGVVVPVRLMAESRLPLAAELLRMAPVEPMPVWAPAVRVIGSPVIAAWTSRAARGAIVVPFAVVPRALGWAAATTAPAGIEIAGVYPLLLPLRVSTWPVSEPPADGMIVITPDPLSGPLNVRFWPVVLKKLPSRAPKAEFAVIQPVKAEAALSAPSVLEREVDARMMFCGKLTAPISLTVAAVRVLLSVTVFVADALPSANGF